MPNNLSMSNRSLCRAFLRTILLSGVTRHKRSLTLWTYAGLFVSSLLMKVCHCTGTTTLSSACRLFATIKANLHSLICKVNIMLFPMAMNTERDTVGNVKTQFGILCPLFDMVRLYLAFGSALLATVIIANIDRLTPNFQFRPKSRPLSFKRLPIFPSRSIYSYLEFLAACISTELLLLFLGNECFSAANAFDGIYNTSMRPAFFGTVEGSFSAIRMGFVFFTTYFTGKFHSASSHKSFPHIDFIMIASYMYYTSYVDIMQAKTRQEADYIDVCVRRWEAETGQTATLLERAEETSHV